MSESSKKSALDVVADCLAGGVLQYLQVYGNDDNIPAWITSGDTEDMPAGWQVFMGAERIISDCGVLDLRTADYGMAAAAPMAAPAAPVPLRKLRKLKLED